MTADTTTTRAPSAPRLTPEALAEVYSLGAHRAIIDAADGHIAAPMLRALAHVSGLAHAAAGYPRHLLSPLRDVLAAVDRLPDAASLAAWALGELPSGGVEPRPDGEVERLRAEVAQARAEGEAAGAARERADVAAYLRRHDVVIEDRRAVQSADMQSRLVVVHVVPRDAAADIEAGEHVGAAGGGAR